MPLVLLAGCGGGDDDSPSPPSQTASEDPRVEGKWRVVYTPISTNEQESRATWTTTPECDKGPCDFSIKSTAGAKYQFTYDPTIKDWTGRDRRNEDCGEVISREVKVKGGYKVLSQITLQPIRAVQAESGTFATEMFGDRRDQGTPTPEAEKAGCDASVDQSSVHAVRIDPPAGKEKLVGPQGEEGVPPGD